MRPFTFSLQAVRTLRQRQEQLALEAFGECVRQRQGAINLQQLAERQLSAGLDQLTVLQSEGAPSYHLNQLRGHCLALEQRLGGCRSACVKAQEAANQAWDKLQDTRCELELVDKLYLRRREDYDRELRCEEQKQLDEMSGRRSLFGAITTQPTALAWN